MFLRLDTRDRYFMTRTFSSILNSLFVSFNFFDNFRRKKLQIKVETDTWALILETTHVFCFFHQASDAGVARIASKAIFLSFLRSGVMLARPSAINIQINNLC